MGRQVIAVVAVFAVTGVEDEDRVAFADPCSERIKCGQDTIAACGGTREQRHLLRRVTAELWVVQHRRHGARISGGDWHVELRHVGIVANANEQGVGGGEYSDVQSSIPLV